MASRSVMSGRMLWGPQGRGMCRRGFRSEKERAHVGKLYPVGPVIWKILAYFIDDPEGIVSRLIVSFIEYPMSSGKKMPC
jgi:hypothetical protein